MSHSKENPPAFFDSTGTLRCWDMADPLPAGWTGIAKHNQTLFWVGKEGEENSYTALQAKTMAEARSEVAARNLTLCA